MTTREVLITAEEFFEIAENPENESRLLELHDGEIVEMPSPDLLHNMVVMLISGAFWDFLKEHPVGYVFGDNTDYILSRGLVYKPDVSVVAKERLPVLTKRFKGAPDIAVEVVSPSNYEPEMIEKVENYIRYGSRMVLLMYPLKKTIRVCRPQEDGTVNIRALKAEDWLDGEDVLPGFRVQVKTLFPDLPVEENEGE